LNSLPSLENDHAFVISSSLASSCPSEGTPSLPSLENDHAFFVSLFDRIIHFVFLTRFTKLFLYFFLSSAINIPDEDPKPIAQAQRERERERGRKKKKAGEKM
jgi:hypothetical protein